MSKGQFCVYLSKDQSKKIKSFIYDSKIFNKNQLDNLFDVLPDNYLEIMMSVLQTTYRRPLDINNSIDKSIIKDYIINKYNELNSKEEVDSDIDYYTTGEVVNNEEVESLKENNAGVFQSFIGNVNNNLIKFRRAVFENAKQQGIEITDKKDSDFYKFITSLSDSIIRKLMKEGKIITIRPNDNLTTNMAVQVNGDVITITYNPLLVVRDADKFDAIISHELLHTVTAAAVNNTQHNIANEEEQQFTKEIFDIIKDLAQNENFYWDMNIDISSFKGRYKYIKEFIANVMSNEELREHLSNIKYQQNNPDIAEEEKTSVLTKVFKSIYNYIRSFYSKDTDKDLDQSYLEKLTKIIQSHIDTQPSNAFNKNSYTEGKVGDASKVEFKWDQKTNNNYEVSSKGDKRFSALYATFKKGTIIEGVDVGGWSIEKVYQEVIKKSGKGKSPSKDSKLYNPKLKTDEEREDFSYYEGYLPLWQEWARQNPELIEELREKAKGKILTDEFAKTRVSQARALADILNNGYSSKNTSIATKNYTKTTPSDNPNTNFVFTDNAQAYTALHDVEGVDKSQFNRPKEGVKLNVTANNNQAGIRMKNNTTANSNTYGLVVKKNQQDNEGKFIHQEGTFKDTEEDFKMFVTLNEHMFNRLEASDNKEVIFPSRIALGRAALPKRFAEWLQQQLRDRYGLDYNLEENENKNYEGWGLRDSSSTKAEQSKKTTPINLSKNYYIKDKNLTITASNSVSYKQRTIDNIENSDITIALAADFTSAGEGLTKDEAEGRKKYVSENIKGKSIKDAKEIAESLFKQIQALGKDTDNELNLNIAGNGIYQNGMPSQEEVDDLVLNILKELQKLGLQIKSIRSGGQTGIDEAGIKASLALGLPTILHGTKDFKFRKKEGKQNDIKNDIKQYLERFSISEEDIKGVIDNKVESPKKTTSVKTGKTKEEASKEDEEKKRKKAALDSYRKEAPKLNINIDKSKLDSILINNIPNLAQRVALEKAVYHLFNNYWNYLLQRVKEDRKTIQDENLIKIYDYILKGTYEEQKLKLLNSLSYVKQELKNGQYVDTVMNPIKYMMSTILDDIRYFASVTSQQTKTNSRGEQVQETVLNIEQANQLINYYLVQLDADGNIQYDSNGVPIFKRNTPFGESFYLRYGANNQYLKQDLKAAALDFVKNLSVQIKPIADEETFNAIFIKSQRILKHNNNIKINFLNKGVSNNEDQSNLNEPEEEDRSGLNLVKFKTLEPSKRMSQRVRNLLSQTPRYLNNNIQFNTLGLVEYLTPDIAYYQLVDKFAAVRNEQDYNNLLNSLSEEYPWFQSIKEKIDQDEIFRNDFYSAFRNVFNRYAIINSRGKISYLNGEAALSILIDDLQSTYESGLLLNEFSIYKSDTNPNVTNITRFRDNVLHGVLKNFSQNFQKLKKIKEGRDSIDNTTTKQIATLLKQLLILSDYKLKQEGYSEDTYLFNSSISLKSILNTFGVSTDKIDLSHLYTSFEEIIEFINSQEEFKDTPINIKDFSDIILNSDNEVDKIEALSDFIENTDGLLDAFINYFTQSNIESKINKLSNILNAMSVIVNNKSGFINTNTNLVQSFYKQYLRILSPLKDTTEVYGTTTFQFDNKSRPSYSAPSYASDIMRHLNTINTQEDLDNFKIWVEQEFTQFDFYKDSEGKCNHLWIKTLLDFIDKNPSLQDIKEFARNFDSTEILGVGGSDSTKNSIGKVNTQVLLKYLIPAAFNAPYTEEQSFGYFRNPLYSDKDVLVLFKAPMFRGKGFKEKVIDQLYKVWEAEYNRIVFYSNRKQFKNKNNSIEGLEKTGDKYHFFPEFNDPSFYNDLPLDSLEREAYVKEKLFELLEKNFEIFYQTAYSDLEARGLKQIVEGSIQKKKGEEDEIKFYYEEEEDTENEEENQQKENKEDEIIRNIYEQFYYNDFMNYIESIRLFQGDPALYGNSTALVKRGAQSHVFGQRGYFIDENGNPITERCIYIEDYYADSNSMANVMALLRQDAEVFSDLEKGMIEGLIRKTANYYKDICTTDGQSFRTIKSIKKILKGFGKLTPEIKESLNNIEAGKIKAEDLIKIINNLKPFLYSNESRILKAGKEEYAYERNEKVITQHKNSEYALSALYSILNSVLNKSNVLKGLQKFMEDNDIDVAHFKSVVKVGANNLFDLNDVYNSKLNDVLKEIKYSEEENKLYLELPLNIDNKNETIIIDIDSGFQGKTPAEQYKIIRNSLKINPEKDINLSQNELNQKQKIYNAFQKQYGLESLPEKEVVSILNSQLNTDDEGNTSTIPNLNKIHTFKLQDYVLVQPVDDHYLDHEAIFGSQLRNIVPANLPDNFTCTLKIKGKEVQLNKEQTIQLYNTLITDQLLDSYNIDLRRKFTSIQEFKKYIDDLIASNDKYGEDIYNALQLDETGTDFRVPLTSPNLSNKIDEIILSAAKNAIQRQKIKGGNIVLISNFGFTNTLETKTETIEIINDKGEKEKRKRIKYIPCYAPMSMMQIYQDYLEEESDEKGNVWYTIDFKKLKEDGNIDSKFLNMIGYRIPTENNYSIMPLRIVGILPQSMGSSIMLPHDIITMSGTDFDIDKLFLMLRAIFTEVGRSTNILNAIKKAESDPSFKELLESLSEKEKKELENRKAFLEKKDFPVTDIQLETLKNNRFIKQVIESAGDEAIYDTDERKIKVKSGKYVFNQDGELDISESSKLSSIKNAASRKEVRNNMLIDIIEAIITSPYGSGRSQKPGQFDSLKRQSLIHKIVNDRQAFQKYIETHKDSNNILESLIGESDKYLKKFYEEYAEVQNPNDILWYVNQHYNLMQGNDLIGGAAVASSNHLKLQNLPNFRLKEGLFNQLPFKYKGNTYYLGSEGINRVTSPITKQTISDLYAEVQAAAPDNGKDPVLGYLGINLDNLYFVNYLIGLGLPIEAISNIMLIYKNLESYINTFFDKKNNRYDITNNKYLNSAINGGYDGDISNAVNIILTNSKALEENPTYIRGFLNMILALDYQASILNNISSYSRVDSTNGALPVLSGEAIQQRLKVQKFIKEMNTSNFPFNGLEDFINTSLDPEVQYLNENGEIKEEFRDKLLESPISRMQAMYSLGITGASTLMSRHLISMNPSIIENLETLAKENGINLLGKKGLVFINNYLKNITTYLMSSNQFIGDAYDTDNNLVQSQKDNSNYYIHDFPIKLFNSLPKLRKKYPELSILKNILVSKNKGILLQSVTNITEQTRNIFREELEYMLKSDNAELNKTVLDLFLYSYYKTGLQYKYNSYGILFSTFFLDMLGDVIPNLKEATRDFSNYTDNYNKEDLERYSFQFLLNNINLIRRINPKSIDTKTITDAQGNTIQYLLLGKSQSGTLLKHEYQGEDGVKGLKYINVPIKVKNKKTGSTRTVIQLYELSESTQDGYLYRPINFNRSIFLGTDGYRPYYNRNLNNIEFNKEIFELKSQGEIMKIETKNKKDNKVYTLNGEELQYKKEKPENDEELVLNRKDNLDLIEGPEKKSFANAPESDSYTYTGIPQYIINRTDQEVSIEDLMSEEKFNRIFGSSNDLNDGITESVAKRLSMEEKEEDFGINYNKEPEKDSEIPKMKEAPEVEDKDNKVCRN